MHFWLQIAWLWMNNRFVCTFNWCLHFSLRCFCFFLVCNCQISDAIFRIVVFWHFSDCVHMCIAHLFVRVLAWLFAFWYCMHIRLFTLFFAIVLCIIYLFFFAKFLRFVLFVFLQTNPGVTSSIYEGFCRFRSCFFALTFVGPLHCTNLPFTLFYYNNFYVLLRSFCAVILCCDFVWFT